MHCSVIQHLCPTNTTKLVLLLHHVRNFRALSFPLVFHSCSRSDGSPFRYFPWDFPLICNGNLIFLSHSAALLILLNLRRHSEQDADWIRNKVRLYFGNTGSKQTQHVLLGIRFVACLFEGRRTKTQDQNGWALSIFSNIWIRFGCG